MEVPQLPVLPSAGDAGAAHGQGEVLQASEESGATPAQRCASTVVTAPFSVCPHPTERDRVPPPQATLQVPKSPATHAVGHASVEHACQAGGALTPLQKATSGATDWTQMMLRLCAPPPQSKLHVDQSDGSQL
jgi:hypothetical protein